MWIPIAWSRIQNRGEVFSRRASLSVSNHSARARLFSGGKLAPAMHDVLALCAKHDLVLQTCHPSPRESIALIKEATDLYVGGRSKEAVRLGFRPWRGATVEQIVSNE